MMLHEDRLPPASDGRPAEQRTDLWPSIVVGTPPPPMRTNVGYRSMFDVSADTLVPWGTPGPVAMSGTRMSVSNAVCFPLASLCSPM